MISRTALLFLPILALAQEPAQQKAPSYVDEALRARVNGFYQNFVESTWSPRKAEPFVAEDTKEYFYNAGKEKYESFKIGKITYADDFTKATVTVIARGEKRIANEVIMMDLPTDTHWKVEDGKWCWTYHEEDYPVTPMSVANPPRADGAMKEPGLKPKDTSPAAIRTAGLAVLEQQPLGFDRSTIVMSPDHESSDQVVFKNGADGEIQIGLDGPTVRGLKVKLDKTTVPAHGTATVSFHYDPSDKSSSKDDWEPKGMIQFRILATPFNRVFALYVQFPVSK